MSSAKRQIKEIKNELIIRVGCRYQLSTYFRVGSSVGNTFLFSTFQFGARAKISQVKKSEKVGLFLLKLLNLYFLNTTKDRWRHRMQYYLHMLLHKIHTSSTTTQQSRCLKCFKEVHKGVKNCRNSHLHFFPTQNLNATQCRL